MRGKHDDLDDHGGDHGGGGAGRAIDLHFFSWVDFLGLQLTWIMYEFYHLKAEQ